MDKQAEKSKNFLIKMHRKRKGLCELCGHFKTDEVHDCIENYIQADTTELTLNDLKEENVERTKEFLEKKVKIEEEKKRKEEETKFNEYIVVDNTDERIEYSYLEFLARKYKTITIYLLIKDKEKTRIISSLSKINRLFNVYFYELELRKFNEIVKLLTGAKYVFCSQTDILRYCKKYYISKYIELPENVKLNINIVKETDKYWKIK